MQTSQATNSTPVAAKAAAEKSARSFAGIAGLGILLLGHLSGCANPISRPALDRPSVISRSPSTPPPAVADEQQSELPPATQIIRPTISTAEDQPARSLPAAIALRDQAGKTAKDGDHRRAIVLLERAVRISPDDPLTFKALAENHLALSQPREALQLARRGLSLNPTAAQGDELRALVSRCEAML